MYIRGTLYAKKVFCLLGLSLLPWPQIGSYFMSIRSFKHVSIHCWKCFTIDIVYRKICPVCLITDIQFTTIFLISSFFCFMDTFYLTPCINITPTPDEIELWIANSMISIELKLIVDKQINVWKLKIPSSFCCFFPPKK